MISASGPHTGIITANVIAAVALAVAAVSVWYARRSTHLAGQTNVRDAERYMAERQPVFRVSAVLREGFSGGLRCAWSAVRTSTG